MGQVRCFCGAEADVWQVGTDRAKNLIDSDTFLDCCEELKRCAEEGKPAIQKHECPHMKQVIQDEYRRLVSGEL